MKNIKIVIEKHTDGYVAYPVGLKGVVVGQGNTYDEALANIKSAVLFHTESFGKDAFEEDESPIVELFVAEMPMAS
jgi:predicted RNase H-like HicB family nuclease